MPVSWERESERLVICRIRGQLSLAEWQELNTGDDLPGHDNNQLALVLLEDFQGWDRAEGWGDLDFVEENDKRLVRIAFVGPDEWREPMEVFMLKGLRPVDIRYFGPQEEALARAWLEGA